ncbi:MAG: 4Fe-4S binding protein, partial [Desulfosarcinaceae bacterium]
QAHHFDLVVLAVGMRPADNLLELLKPIGVPFDSWGFFSSQNPLPARMQVAGAGRFPTDIVGAMLQGVNAAHCIAGDLVESADNKKTPGTIAVFGNGPEGRRVARAIQDAGYSALLLEEQTVSGNDAPPCELIAPARVTGLGGSAGNFTLRYVKEGQTAQRQVMALVVANGVERRSPASSLPVVSLPEIEGAMATDSGNISSRVVFLLDQHGPEDKTNFRRALECAVELSGSGREVTIVMEKVLVHAADGQKLYDRARKQGVRFLRAADAGAVRIAEVDGGFELTMQDSTLGDLELVLGCDLVVSAEEILPALQTARIAGLIKEPLDREGFAQAANVRLRPINSRKKGIFYLGRCHEENDDGDLDKEIRNLICQLALMDRRAPGADETALIDERLCGRCLTCFRTCPHGAVAIVNDRQPQIQPNACVGCGLCVSQCPARAISLGPTPLNPGKEGQTVVYACRRSGSLAASRALDSGLITPDESLAIVQVPCCRSRIGIQELLDAIQAGARRVVVAACHQGNCQSVDADGTPDEHLRHRAGSIGLTDTEVSWHTLAANEPVRLQQIL